MHTVGILHPVINPLIPQPETDNTDWHIGVKYPKLPRLKKPHEREMEFHGKVHSHK